MKENPLRPNEQDLGGFGFPRPDDERDWRVRAAVERIDAGLEQLMNGERYQDFLRAARQFHTYSFNNIMLIMAQRPDATRVAGMNKWNSMGRWVNKGEHPINIIALRKQAYFIEDPDTGEKVKKERLIGWMTVNVYDIAQTNGKPIPEPPRPAMLDGESDRSSQLFQLLAAYSVDQGATIGRQPQERLGRVHGSYDPRTKEIAVSILLKHDHAAKTHAHETAHFIADHQLHHDSKDIETEAEIAACIVMDWAGADTSAYSFPYVAGHAQDLEVVKRNLERSRKTAHQIITGVEHLAANPPRTSMVVYDRARSREKSLRDSGVQAW